VAVEGERDGRVWMMRGALRTLKPGRSGVGGAHEKQYFLYYKKQNTKNINKI
jgi:hypothetical protein